MVIIYKKNIERLDNNTESLRWVVKSQSIVVSRLLIELADIK